VKFLQSRDNVPEMERTQAEVAVIFGEGSPLYRWTLGAEVGEILTVTFRDGTWLELERTA